ncbi:MAG: PilZ domain-containing protein [Solirubrobacteraceae bacterium]
MRIGRSRSPAETPALPEISEQVVLRLPDGARLPARVLERGEDSLLVALTVPARPLTAAQLEGVVLECSSERGRCQLRGVYVMEDPEAVELVRMTSLRSVELLQEREYVRIKSSRPALVYSARDRNQVQSFTVDVSGGGLLLAGPDTLQVGEQVQFRLTLTPGMLPISGTGRVVRGDGDGRWAIEFEKISDLDRRRLVRFVFECRRAEGKHERR